MKKQSSNVRSAAARILKGLLGHSAWERGTHLPDQVVLQELALPVFKSEIKKFGEGKGEK